MGWGVVFIGLNEITKGVGPSLTGVHGGRLGLRYSQVRLRIQTETERQTDRRKSNRDRDSESVSVTERGRTERGGERGKVSERGVGGGGGVLSE